MCFYRFYNQALPSITSLNQGVPMKSRSTLLLCAALLLTYSHLSAQILPETTTDYLNIYKIPGHDKSYQTLLQAGAKVINFTADTSFACIWIPPNYSTQAVKRVMVCMHGSKGAAYDEMKDELAYAQANNYAMVGVQWWIQGATPSADGTYLDEAKMYRLIDTALKHVKAKYSADLSRVGYVGFSRGSAASYLIMFYDRFYKTNYFALSISASGGIPVPPNPPKPPLGDVLQKRYGITPFLGASFFFYCGMKDEEWGTTMCDQIAYADSIVRANGGQTVRRISDPEGKHGGYRLNPGYQASAVQWFLDLTSTPTPPALVQPADKAINQPLFTTVQWTTNATASLYDLHISGDPGFFTTVSRDSLISASVTSKRIGEIFPGTTLYWRVRSKNNIGASAWSEGRSFTAQRMTGVADDKNRSAEDKGLRVSPNPASENISVQFTLSKPERVTLKFYNVLGQEVASLLDAETDAGEHTLQFSTQHLECQTLFLRLQTNSGRFSQMVTVMR